MFANGGESVGLIPTRYIGSVEQGGALALAHRTEWAEPLPGFYTGLGQRVLTTDQGDLALMDIRRIDINPSADTEGGEDTAAAQG
jgi:type VI secretion system protein ImpE